jgi:hypothetical protein
VTARRTLWYTSRPPVLSDSRYCQQSVCHHQVVLVSVPTLCPAHSTLFAGEGKPVSDRQDFFLAAVQIRFVFVQTVRTSSPINPIFFLRRLPKKGYAYEGNIKLNELVRLYTKEYSSAKTKDEKSNIVSTIAAEVHRLSPNGGFVKRDEEGWYEVGAFLAREKISQVFRNILQDNYKSSTRMRRVVRQAQRQLLRSGDPSYATTTTTTNGASSPNDSVTGKYWAVFKQ